MFDLATNGQLQLCASRGNALLVFKAAKPRNRMREIFTYGSVGGAAG